MVDLVSKLTGEQALRVVERLHRRGGEIREAVLAEAKNVLTDVDLEATADEVFTALDSIDVEDCFARSGGSRDHYTSPDEAAGELIEEELRPFTAQVDRYHEMGMHDQEAAYCMGVLLGIYRYEQESTRSSASGRWTFRPNVAAFCWTPGWNETGERRGPRRCASSSQSDARSGIDG